ncbi:MAG: hypothetical protein JRN58_00165 [Nitrososphaerota archaeon]|nr:hypothetical protein [Nitrososphaerota archaeon]
MLEKAIDAVCSGSVKSHLFLPTGRCIFTVVGSNADEFIDLERLFCSCESYFYRVLGGKTKYCYHLLAYRIASESGLVSEITFDDEEYDVFIRLLASDVLHSRDIGKEKATGGI